MTRSGDKKNGIEPLTTKSSKKSRDEPDDFPVYAHIKTVYQGSQGKSQIQSFFVHNREIPTRVNLKQTLLELTRSMEHESNIDDNDLNAIDGSSNSIDEEPITAKSNLKVEHREGKTVTQATLTNRHLEDKSPSILLPDILDQWEVHSESSGEHSIVKSASGWQNVTLRSRIYNDAHSKLYLTFDLKFVKEVNQEKESFSSAASIEEVIRLLGDDYFQKDYSTTPDHRRHEYNTHMTPEKTVCHDCRTMAALVQDYQDFMTGEKAASVQASIAFLKLLERVRLAGPGTSKDDIVSLLKKLDKDYKHDVLSSVLDVLAAARTETSVMAAFQFLDLKKNNDLDISERFLESLATSCVTALSTSAVTQTDLASHRFIVEELYRILDRDEAWKSNKLRWTTFVTLASVSKSYTNRIRSLKQRLNDKKASDESDTEVSKRVVNLIMKELESCDDVDCKLALLTSLSNSGNLLDSFDLLESFALDTKGKRESIAAMKVIKECLEDSSNQPLSNSTLNQRLRILSLKVVYDDKHESTSRIIAAEIIVRHIKDPVLIAQLLKAVYDGWFGE